MRATSQSSTHMSVKADKSHCFHCGLPVPSGSDFGFEYLGERKPACCQGCEAVARAILDSGLADYYKHRTAYANQGEGLVPNELSDFAAYDEQNVPQSQPAAADIHDESLILEGVTCAACIWLIERHLRKQPGVLEVSVNFSTRRAALKWDAAKTRLSDVLRSLFAIGYTAYPYDPQKQQAVMEREGRQYLRRIGVAGLFGMQVMVVAVGLYVGLWRGIDDHARIFLEWVSALLTLPVVLYSAQPFYRAAIRNVRVRRLGMDVPVSLGIIGAYAASIWSTATNTGSVFYESVCMFAGFLLVARYFEFLTRRHSVDVSERLTHQAPQMAHRILDDGALQLTAVTALKVDDRVLVKPGGTIPTDATVLRGESDVDESILTGESHPVRKRAGDEVIGGSLNLDQTLELAVQRTGQESTLSTLARLVERAQKEKPKWVGVADRAASGFVIVVLGLTVLTAIYWWRQADPDWLATALSVLVVTCPCAFSLATPTAMAAAIGALFRNGVVVTRAGAIENLARSSVFVFDKTGTLTDGQMQVVQQSYMGNLSEDTLRSIVVGLERHSDHPIARALSRLPAQRPAQVENVTHLPALGVSGVWRGQRYHLGSAECMHQLPFLALDATCDYEGNTTVYLADERQILARFELTDHLRPGGSELIDWLKHKVRRVSLYSGDQISAVRSLAERLGIEDYRASMKPDQKLNAMRDLQASYGLVAMVGDGVNDAPVLAGADVSLSVAGATQLAHASSDMLLLNNDLSLIKQAIGLTRKTRAVIRQNIIWALSYNLLALPLAALGYILPWQAALGMSASSLVVVLNSYRLRWFKAKN